MVVQLSRETSGTAAESRTQSPVRHRQRPQGGDLPWQMSADCFSGRPSIVKSTEAVSSRNISAYISSRTGVSKSLDDSCGAAAVGRALKRRLSPLTQRPGPSTTGSALYIDPKKAIQLQPSSSRKTAEQLQGPDILQHREPGDC